MRNAAKYNLVFNELFMLRHYGLYDIYEKYVEELQHRADFKTPDMQVLIKLSDAYCMWVKGEPMQKAAQITENVDTLIPQTDSRIGLEALRLHVSLLKCLQEGKLVEGMERGYGALQAVHHLPPGYLKGFIFSFAAYLFSLLIANETEPKARDILRQKGIEYCKLGIDSTALETSTQHLSVTCDNLKSTCFLYLAMLHLDATFTVQTASRGRRVFVENLTAAGEALVAAAQSNPAPFTRARILLLTSDFNFRQWQEFSDRKYHKEALQNAREAKKFAKRFRFLSEIQHAKERIAFLEEQFPLCGG
ncbi:Hypp3263 [Branchiostoma lanceolatum]|uniref:Hypp3263 protein n=1 Tax=Branchiostoma lanceolatum TaxID=7740 RepID=A0A8K0ETX6_BRALA|nr:Hypp3263 [Branchiostoma lanceolatum]